MYPCMAVSYSVRLYFDVYIKLNIQTHILVGFFFTAAPFHCIEMNCTRHILYNFIHITTILHIVPFGIVGSWAYLSNLRGFMNRKSHTCTVTV